MDINWIILSLECKTNENGLTNVVYKVYWKCIATLIDRETEYTAEMHGPLVISSPDPNNFIPYESLTKEQVVTWVKDEFGVEKTQEIYDYLQNNINEQINPTIVSLEPPFEN